MMLFVMSAYVAFNGFPGQDVENPLSPLLVQQQRQAHVSVPTVRVGSKVQRGQASHAAASRARHGGSGASERPKASTGPVSHRTPTPGQSPTATPAAPGSTESPTRVLPTGAPSVPKPSLPSHGLPQVQLPSVQVPLPGPLPTIDTGKVTTPVTNTVNKVTAPVNDTVDKVTAPVNKVTAPVNKVTAPVNDTVNGVLGGGK